MEIQGRSACAMDLGSNDVSAASLKRVSELPVISMLQQYMANIVSCGATTATFAHPQHQIGTGRGQRPFTGMLAPARKSYWCVPTVVGSASQLIFHASPRLLRFNVRIREEAEGLQSETNSNISVLLEGEFFKNALWSMMVIEPICLISRKNGMEMLSERHCLGHKPFHLRLMISCKGWTTCKRYSVVFLAISMGWRKLSKDYQRCVR